MGKRRRAGAFAACLLALSIPVLAQVKLDEGTGPKAPRKADAVATAKAELGRVLKISRASIGLVSATAARWPDASLGCPEEGRMYAQVVTRGWTVLLQAAGKQHEVRVSGKRARLCPPAR